MTTNTEKKIKPKYSDEGKTFKRIALRANFSQPNVTATAASVSSQFSNSRENLDSLSLSIFGFPFVCVVLGRSYSVNFK